ncbi:MAG: thioredoxin family protein [Tissierellia bacterium]|nr:thioredoxin family protein [Tissierellia bacterium]
MNYLFFVSKSCSLCNGMYDKSMKLFEKFNIEGKTIDISENPKLRGKYNVFSAPTVIILENEKEVHRESGFFDFYMLQKIISR